MAEDHYKKQSDIAFVSDGPDAIEEARKMHRLATADPEPERDGTLTGTAHEEKYKLERAKDSAEHWRSLGVHPTENRALRPGEDGFENTDEGLLEAAISPDAPENAAAPRVSDSK